MKMMDLSFWEPPNWEKESKISPAFWIALAGFVAVALLSGYCFFLSGSESDLNRQLAENNSFINKMKPQFTQFTSKGELCKSAEYFFLTDLKERAKTRLLASEVMEKLFTLVPENMVLRSVSFDAIAYEPAKSKDKKKSKASGPKPVIQKLRHRLSFSAVVTGIRSEKDVMDFSDLLGSEKGFGGQLLSSEIKGTDSSVSEEHQTMQTTFNIECVFKEK